MQLHLIDSLASATIDAPSPACVAVQSVTIRRESRTCIFQHPNSTVRFPNFKLPRDARLKLGIGIKDVSWDKVNSAVTFRASVIDRREQIHTVFEHTLDARGEAGRKWIDADIDLRQFANRAVSLLFETVVQNNGDTSYCWTAWSDPQITGASAKAGFFGGTKHKHVQKKQHKNVLLITSDALRRDHLGCYGHPFVKTPNIDRLAEDGVLFTNARAQTSTTMGSYASILTGAHALRHGLMAEWGTLKTGLPTLPQILHQAGFDTVVAASESELVEDRQGFISYFNENIACLAVPAQSGDVTTRQFIQWLDSHADTPFFGWVQFFDTHPPSIPPARFTELYYQQDPCDSITAYATDKVGRIRGVESVLRIQCAIQFLRDGFVDLDILHRLRDTADSFCERHHTGPDLVQLLAAMEPSARRGLSVRDFGEWLSAQVSELEQNRVPAELVEWLETLVPQLLNVETEILSWLKDVIDFRYPIAQYMAEVTFMDYNVGLLIDALKERGIYDETTILFTSPHGELLDEGGLHFHHHALMEPVLQVPAIFKPASTTGAPKGVRIDGVLDQVDMMPTILESLGLPIPIDVAGKSRWQNVLEGAPIAKHDSFAVDIHGSMLAVARAEFAFLKALAPYVVSPEWEWLPGKTALFRITVPMSYERDVSHEFPDVAAELEKALDDFVAAHQEKSLVGAR